MITAYENFNKTRTDNDMSINLFFRPWRKSKDGTCTITKYFFHTVKSTQYTAFIILRVHSITITAIGELIHFMTRQFRDVLVILCFANNVGHIFFSFGSILVHNTS